MAQALRPIPVDADTLGGTEADARKGLIRRAIRSSRAGIAKEKSNGNSSIGGQTVAGATRISGGSL